MIMELLLSLWIALTITNISYLYITFSKCIKNCVIDNDTDITFSIIFWIQFFTVSTILSFGFAPFLFKKIMLEKN